MDRSPSSPAPPTGADLMCSTLVDEGVDVLFGHPGGAILPFYDAVYRHGGLRHVLMRHEAAAAHAADGWSRVTGQVGVCVSTSGPGATNLVTGLATAMMDSVPLLAITGQVARPVIGTDAFQETDILGMSAPVTKYGVQVTCADELPGAIRRAMRMARSGRPGPVLIDVPKDVQAEVAAHPPSPGGASSNPPFPSRMDGDTHEAVVRAADLINAAERPVLMLGRGVVLAGVASEVRKVAEWASLPVVTSLLGLDAFPARHPLALGLPGMHGTPRANRAIQEADLIVGLGIRFDDRVVGDPRRFAPHARIVHFEIDPSVPGRTVTPYLTVLGDLAATVPALQAALRPRTRHAWLQRLAGWERAAERIPEDAMSAGPPRSRAVLRALARRVSRGRAVVATDVGQHQMWLAQELPDVEPGAHITSGGLGTMGYALPAGIGAAIGRPEREVWVVAGDGGFQMNIQELATAAEAGLRIRMVVVNNRALGMVRQWQELFYDGRYSASELTGPDFAEVARAYGIEAWAVESEEALEDALSRAESVDGPALVEVHVRRGENVWPLVPSGAALDEFVTQATEAVP